MNSATGFTIPLALPPLHSLSSDENARKAEGHHTFYMVGCVEVSPNHQFVAWTEDTTGNERYTLRVMVGQKGRREIGWFS